MNKLTKGEILRIVNSYIGVSGGYLGDFTYRTHGEFYPEYCGIDHVDLNTYAGTTRERFIAVLESASPADQAKIVQGVIKRFPPTTDSRVKNQHELQKMIERLEASSPVSTPNLKIQSEAVKRAIADAEILIRERGATSGIDRVHTALQGYLQAACDSKGITYAADSEITGLFKLLRDNHAGFQPSGPRSADITQLLRALATILSVLNPLRNRASGAHPNPKVLELAEAKLVINVTNSLLHYLDEKV